MVKHANIRLDLARGSLKAYSIHAYKCREDSATTRGPSGLRSCKNVSSHALCMMPWSHPLGALFVYTCKLWTQPCRCRLVY